MSDRRCQAANRSGDPCRAAPLRESQWCGAHDPQRPAGTRFGSPEQAAEAATGVDRRTPSVAEQMRERVEARAEAILAPYFDALAAGEEVETRMRAAERLLDRVYGRPKQSAEVTQHVEAAASEQRIEAEVDRLAAEVARRAAVSGGDGGALASR